VIQINLRMYVTYLLTYILTLIKWDVEQAHHVSFRTCISVRMTVMQEKCFFVSVPQGSWWTGSYPEDWQLGYIPLNEL